MRTFQARISGINTDRFPKRAPKVQASRRIGGRAPPGNFFGFLLLKSPFLGSESFEQDIDQISPWKVFLLLKMCYYEWTVTDFRKTVETGVHPRMHSFNGRNRRCMQLDNLKYHMGNKLKLSLKEERSLVYCEKRYQLCNT